MLRIALILCGVLLLAGCSKTIHEASAKPAPAAGAQFGAASTTGVRRLCTSVEHETHSAAAGLPAMFRHPCQA